MAASERPPPSPQDPHTPTHLHKPRLCEHRWALRAVRRNGCAGGQYDRGLCFSRGWWWDLCLYPDSRLELRTGRFTLVCYTHAIWPRSSVQGATPTSRCGAAAGSSAAMQLTVAQWGSSRAPPRRSWTAASSASATAPAGRGGVMIMCYNKAAPCHAEFVQSSILNCSSQNAGGFYSGGATVLAANSVRCATARTHHKVPIRGLHSAVAFPPCPPRPGRLLRTAQGICRQVQRLWKVMPSSLTAASCDAIQESSLAASP